MKLFSPSQVCLPMMVIMISLCPYLNTQTFVIFSLPYPAEEGSDRMALMGNWCPVRVNTHHTDKKGINSYLHREVFDGKGFFNVVDNV